MKYSEFLLGNSSSGIIESASFGNYVINVGNKQKGRARGENVVDCLFSANSIVYAVKKVKSMGDNKFGNIYASDESANQIINIIKSRFS